MDNIRFVLIMALVMISYMLWEAWQLDYGPKPQTIASEKPVINGATPQQANARNADGTPVQNTTTVPSRNVVRVQTDVFALEIDSEGATLRNLDLVQYPHEKENTAVSELYKMVGMTPDPKDLSPVRLLDGQDDKLFLAQSGLITSTGTVAAPDHHAVFSAAQNSYTLQPGQDTLEVPLTWQNPQGLTVTKVFTFKRGQYVIDVNQKVSNNTSFDWSGKQYNQLLRVPYSEPSKAFIRTYSGGVIYTEEDKYKKVEFDDMADEDLNVDTQGGWTAMIQHYFATAWIPPAEQKNHFYTKDLKDRYVLGSYSEDVTVKANSEAVFSARLYAGPKIQTTMEAIAPGLELTVDYGWLTFIAKYIYQLLNWIYSQVGNWGFAIMGVTLVIKLLFFKLSQASYQSMARMRKIQPRLKELQEKFADDRQRFNTEMMAMYKREKVNPLGGCLPIMVQIPVFIALYWVLMETVEVRQADFAGWIQDLSAQDPFYLLPILYGITMKIQQGLNPAPVDPLQAQVMRMFPIMFTVFFLFFPSGLVLYWICNNSLSILQQWYITRQIEAADHK